LIMVYAVIFPIALPSALTRGDFLPLDLELYGSLGTILGVTLPAFLVTAATDGWAGVRDLANRCVRWRVGIRWYLIAVLGMPIAMTLATTAAYGTPLLNNLSDESELLFTLVLPQTASVDPAVQLGRGDRLDGILARQTSESIRPPQGVRVNGVAVRGFPHPLLLT